MPAPTPIVRSAHGTRAGTHAADVSAAAGLVSLSGGCPRRAAARGGAAAPCSSCWCRRTGIRRSGCRCGTARVWTVRFVRLFDDSAVSALGHATIRGICFRSFDRFTLDDFVSQHLVDDTLINGDFSRSTDFATNGGLHRIRVQDDGRQHEANSL
jgi:hypothetical protein